MKQGFEVNKLEILLSSAGQFLVNSTEIHRQFYLSAFINFKKIFSQKTQSYLELISFKASVFKGFSNLFKTNPLTRRNSWANILESVIDQL